MGTYTKKWQILKEKMMGRAEEWKDRKKEEIAHWPQLSQVQKSLKSLILLFRMKAKGDS